MNFSQWLLDMVGPVTARWLTSTGFTLVSLTGLLAAYDQLKAWIDSSLGTMAATAIQLGGLFGLWEAIAIILGAYVFVLTWRTTTGWFKLGIL